MFVRTSNRAVVRALSADELVDQVVQLASEQAAHVALWLAMVAEVDRRELWEGARSCAEWLAWKCGLDGRTAREHVRVARHLDQLEAIPAAFAEGRISYSKVRALSRVATAENEEFLLGLALSLSASELDRSLAAYAAAHRDPLTVSEDAERRARCGVTRWVEPDGLVHYDILAPPEEAMLLDKAMEFGRDQAYRERKAEAAVVGGGGGGGEPVRRTGGAAGRLEGLVWSVRNGLVNLARGVEVDDPYLVVVPVEEGEALFTDDGRVDLGNGLALHPRTLQRLCCESMIQVMLYGDNGDRPLDLGRRSREPSRKQRRAVRAMYRTCQFPGECDVPSERCHLHHVLWWGRDEGPTDLDNLVPLCTRHHKVVHEGGWELVFGPDRRLVAIAPDGRRCTSSSPMASVRTGPDAARRRLRAAGVEPDGRELAGAWAGERMTEFARVVIADAVWRELPGTPDAERAAGVAIDASFRGGAPPSPN